jgi:hypothetical protein
MFLGWRCVLLWLLRFLFQLHAIQSKYWHPCFYALVRHCLLTRILTA